MFKNKYIAIAALILALCFAITPRAAEGPKDEEQEMIEDGIKQIRGKSRSLTVPIGISKTIEFPFEIGPIYLTDPGLFDYRRIKDGDKDRKLLIIPKNSGITDMTIHDGNGQPKITYIVRVTREDLGQVMSQLEDLLGDIEGLKMRALGGTIILDGEILLPKDMIRIIRVLDAIKDRDPKKKEVPIRNLASISKVTMNIIAERIEREVGSPELTARVINNNLFLEGTAESSFEADRALEIAKTYLPEVLVEKTKGDGSPELRPKAAGGVGGGLPTIVDLMRVRPTPASPPSQDIKITMNYVELKNDYDKTFNFSWRPLASDQSNVKFDTSLGELSASLVATVSSLLPKLVAAKSHGHARILKQESIIVKDRAETPAVIESSLDIYTPITNDRGERSLQPVPVQNFTKVKAATIPGSDSIDLGIQISLNSLLGTNPPQIAKNSLQTQITIKNGDSAALGGHSIDEAVASYNRDGNPSGGGQQGGGNQTALFDLSRSKGLNHIKQQYVIFVTPEVLRTASSGTEDITRKFRLNAGEK